MLSPTVRAHDAVSTVMAWPVAAVDGNATLRRVAETLAANEVGAAVVLVDGRLAGIVTERDLVTHLADGANPDHVTADEMLNDALVAVAPADTLLTVAARMVESGVRHAPVLSGDQLVGMVSLRDVSAVLLHEVLAAAG
jgi:CBS domain-containing protein